MTGEPDVANVIFRAELEDQEATRRFAKDLAGCLSAGDVVALQGTLGAGKTAMSRALVNALPPAEGEPGQEDVPSPTFTLLQTYYRAPYSIWHFDLYRLKEPEEAYELGIEEAFSEGVSLIEWPERLGYIMPRAALWLTLDFPEGNENARRVTLHAGRPRLAEQWKRKLEAMLHWQAET